MVSTVNRHVSYLAERSLLSLFFLSDGAAIQVVVAAAASLPLPRTSTAAAARARGCSPLSKAARRRPRPFASARSLSTGWAGHLFPRFCLLFSESSPGCWALLQLPCCPSKQGELLENILHITKPSEQVAAPPSISLFLSLAHWCPKFMNSNIEGVHESLSISAQYF